MDMKLCTNCKHCGFNNPEVIKSGGYYTSRTIPCTRVPYTEDISLVDGSRTILWQKFCNLERNPLRDRDDMCGKEAKFFEAK